MDFRSLTVRRGRVLVLALLVLACPTEPLEPALEAIDPPRGLFDRRVAIVLSGRNLALPPVEDGERLEVLRWEGTVGNRPIERISVASSGRIEAIIAPGLTPGPHDVVLRTARHTLSLPAAYTAVPPIAPRIDRVEPAVMPLSGAEAAVRGAGLHYGSRAYVNGVESPVVWIDDRTLRVSVVSGLAGPALLEIVTPIGTSRRDDLLRYADDG